MFNRARIDDLGAYARGCGSASWLFIVGEEFASMPGGMSCEQVQAGTSGFPSCFHTTGSFGGPAIGIGLRGAFGPTWNWLCDLVRLSLWARCGRTAPTTP